MPVIIALVALPAIAVLLAVLARVESSLGTPRPAPRGRTLTAPEPAAVDPGAARAV